MTSAQIVKASYANIYTEPSFSSEMVTQALFFESVDIISEHGNWFKISQWDSYEGYIHKFYLCQGEDKLEDTVLLLDRLTPIYSSQDNQNISMVAPFGSVINYRQGTGGWATINIESKSHFLKVPNNTTVVASRDMVTEYCSRLIGSPYLWGGKTPFGYDCSGFVQAVYKAMDINLERDTSQQIKDTRAVSIDISDVKPGDLVFFDFEGNGVDHVGIWSGDDSVTHCGGHVKTQSIYDDSTKKLIDYIIDIKSMEIHLNG